MDKSCQQSWQDISLLIVRLAVAALFLSAAWGKFTNWDATQEFIRGTGGIITLPAWFLTVYSVLLPFVEAFIGLSFLLGYCHMLGSTLMFLATFSFWIVLSKNPSFPGILNDFHFYLMLLSLMTFSFGYGKYRLLSCNFKCCKD